MTATLPHISRRRARRGAPRASDAAPISVRGRRRERRVYLQQVGRGASASAPAHGRARLRLSSALDPLASRGNGGRGMNTPRTASRKTKVGQGKAVTSLKHTWLEQVAVDSGLPPLAMRAAVRIWSHWNAKTQTARPSYMRIAEDLAASEWGMIKAVKALIERGHLRIAVAGKQGSGHSNAYALVLKGPEKPEAGDRVPEREKPQQAEGFQETEIPQQPLGFSEKVKPQRLAGKNPNGRWDEPLNPTPIVPERSGEAAPPAPSRAPMLRTRNGPSGFSESCRIDPRTFRPRRRN